MSPLVRGMGVEQRKQGKIFKSISHEMIVFSPNLIQKPSSHTEESRYCKFLAREPGGTFLYSKRVT